MWYEQVYILLFLFFLFLNILRAGVSLNIQSFIRSFIFFLSLRLRILTNKKIIITYVIMDFIAGRFL